MTQILQLPTQVHYEEDGVQTVWPFSFVGGYIAREHVRAYRLSDLDVRTDLVLTDANFVTDFQLEIVPAGVNGHKLVIYRDTSNGGLPLVDFADGNLVDEASLDIVAKQSVFVAAESADFLGVTTTADLQDLAQAAATSAGAAAASAAGAASSAAGAATSASSASTSATGAATSASAAATSAANATSAATAAVNAHKAILSDYTDPAKNAGTVGYSRTLNYVTNTIGYKLRETVSCKDQPWNCKGDGVTDDSAAMQAFLLFLYGNSYRGHIPLGTYMVKDINVPISGGRHNGGLTLYGDGFNGSILKQMTSASSHVLRFYGTAAPAPNSINLVMEGIGINGPDGDPTGQTIDGLIFEDLARWTLRDVYVDGFKVGVHLKSALIGEFYGCVLSASLVNLKLARSVAGGAGCNNILFCGGQINYARVHGIDMDYANGVTFYNTDIERNCSEQTLPSGTVTISNGSGTWNHTAHGLATNDPVILTTTGSLPTNFVQHKVYYAIVDSANTYRLAPTIGGADLVAGSAGSGTHTAKSPNRGGVVIRRHCIDEVGYAYITFDTCWFEGNGVSSVVCEYMASAFGLGLTFRGGHILGDGASNMALVVPQFRTLSISDWNCVAAPSRVNVSGDKLSLRGVYILDLVRPAGVSSTIADNSIVNGADWNSGEVGSATLSLTGCTTVPTGTLLWTIQGKTVTITIPVVTGASNSASATLTGMPAALWPSVAKGFLCKNTDNGVEKVSELSIGTNGIITLANGFSGTFTASGTKGTALNITFTYEK